MSDDNANGAEGQPPGSGPLICCLEPRKPLKRAILSLAFSPEGDFLVSGGADQIVRVWDTISHDECDSSKQFDHGVRELAVTPDARIIVIVDREESGVPLADSVWSWNRLRRKFYEIDYDDSFKEMRLHPSNESVAFYCFNGIRLFNLRDGECIRELPKDVGEKFVFTPDGARIVATDWSQNTDDGGRDAVQLRDASSGEIIRDMGYHDSVVEVLAAAPDGQRVASADRNGTIRIWSVERGESVAAFDHPDVGVRQLQFLPDGERLVSVGEDFAVRLWEPGVNDTVSTWEPPRALASWVTSMALSRDGRLAATGENGGAIYLWDLTECLSVV